jgi:hypothetical protein
MRAGPESGAIGGVGGRSLSTIPKRDEDGRFGRIKCDRAFEALPQLAAGFVWGNFINFLKRFP